MVTLVLFVCFDLFTGVALFWKNSALPAYVEYIKQSMEHYGKDETHLVG